MVLVDTKRPLQSHSHFLDPETKKKGINFVHISAIFPTYPSSVNRSKSKKKSRIRLHPPHEYFRYLIPSYIGLPNRVAASAI